MQGLGKRIQKCREEAGMTQEALAERVGISWNYLGAIEREVKTPKLETLVRIINVLEVSADDVMLDVLRVGRKARPWGLDNTRGLRNQRSAPGRKA